MLYFRGLILPSLFAPGPDLDAITAHVWAINSACVLVLSSHRRLIPLNCLNTTICVFPHHFVVVRLDLWRDLFVERSLDLTNLVVQFGVGHGFGGHGELLTSVISLLTPIEVFSVHTCRAVQTFNIQLVVSLT